MKARKKARLAEDTSDLQSEVKCGYSKRKIQRPSWVTSSDNESDETMLPSPPSSHKKAKIVTTPQAESPSLLSINCTDFEMREPQRASCSRCTDLESSLKSLQEQIHLLRSITMDVLKEVRHGNEATKSSTKNNNKAALFFTKFDGLQFPLRTQEQQGRFESILEDKGNFDDAIEEIHTIGGSSSYDFASRALGTKMADELALTYSWLGRQGKSPFSKYRTANLVICTAEKAKVAGSKKEHEGSVQLWLKRASDRTKRMAKSF